MAPVFGILFVTLIFAAQASAASTFYVRGGGDGHGIGMSQYGAYGYALHGQDYRFILAHYYQGTALGRTNPKRIVRVLLASGTAAFSAAGTASNGGANPSSKQLQSGQTYTVQANADGTLSLTSAAGKRMGRFAAPLTVSGAGPLTVSGLGSYRGWLEFRPDGSGGVETVDAVGLEDYIRGVISGEMPSSWAAEALKTQAVAARTYAITTNAGGGAYDVYSDTRSQVYGGVAAEAPSTDAAVKATRGQVVTYAGQPVVTYFFNSSGGHTENIENVWPGATPEPWLRGVSDPYDNAGGDPYHHWGSDLSIEAASAKLGGLLRGRLLGIQVTKHGSSPRILRAEVVGTKGRTPVTGTDLQDAFGLLTTYARFTTISTFAGHAPAPPAAASGSSPPATLGLHGSVFPAPHRATLALQRSEQGAWRTVVQFHLARNGSYDLQLSGPGSYRIACGGLGGPAVAVR